MVDKVGTSVFASKPLPVRRIYPMLAKDANEFVLGTKGYALEEKYDGTRCIVIKWGDDVWMIGRSWINDYAPLYPEIADEIRKLPVDKAILDSELTFFTKDGRDEFLTVLAKREEWQKRGLTPKLMVFDVLELDEYNYRSSPYSYRKEILKWLFENSPKFKYVENVPYLTDETKHKERYIKIVSHPRQGEGVILKQVQSPYREGIRSPEWLKVKHKKTTDAVIVGVTPGKGARADTFGSLILAQWDKKNQRWKLVGHTSGFTQEQMAQLWHLLQKYKTNKSPLEGEDIKKARALFWVEPKIPIEVKYLERTVHGHLRMPDFVRFRFDKEPKECEFNSYAQG